MCVRDPRRGKAGRFKAEHGPKCLCCSLIDQRKRKALFRKRRHGLGARAAGDKSDQSDHDQQWHQFDDRRHKLKSPSLTGSCNVEQGQQPDNAERGERGMFGQHGPETATIRDGRDRNRDHPCPYIDPQAETNEEGRDPAKFPLHKRDRCLTRSGHQTREQPSEAKRASNGNDPAGHCIPAIWRKACWQEEHARTDHVSHDQRDGHEKAELLARLSRFNCHRSSDQKSRLNLSPITRGLMTVS